MLSGVVFCFVFVLNNRASKTSAPKLKQEVE